MLKLSAIQVIFHAWIEFIRINNSQVMKLNIHPEACTNFNGKIRHLLNLFKLRVSEKKETKFQPEIYDAKEIDPDKIIGEFKSGIDEDGSELSKSFLTEEGYVGLFDLNYKEYERICEGLQKLQTFRNVVSLKMILEIIFQWLIKKYKNQIDEEPIEYLISECEKKIEHWEIIIPIAELYIENEFCVGKLKLITLRKGIIDNWEASLIKVKTDENKDISPNLTERYGSLRKSYSGKAAAQITIEAEINRAIEIANEEIEKSLSILRYFSRANVVSNLVSCCTVSGMENISIVKSLVLKNNLLVQTHVNTIGNYLSNWIIDKSKLELYYKMGLENLNILLTKVQLNDFETNLLNSLLIYSKNSLRTNIYDKIIDILTSLEAMLIRDTTDPIQRDLSERIAILIGNNIEEKKQIIKNIKNIYKLRSKFLHRGNQELELAQKEEVKNFLHYVHLFYSHLIGRLAFFKSKEHLIDFIDEKKLS